MWHIYGLFFVCLHRPSNDKANNKYDSIIHRMDIWAIYQLLLELSIAR